MKLINKKTGEIREFDYVGGIEVTAFPETAEWQEYNSLAELNREWEDYEEPKDFYIVEQRGIVGSRFSTDDEYAKKFKEIGNYFKTREEAEKAIEKLKAWKRLKDLGFKCSYHSSGYHRGTFTADFVFDEDKLPILDTLVVKDLDLLFGGEE